MKTIEKLIDEIKASETLQKLLAEAVKNNALADFLKAQGCESTVEEFIAALKAPAAELGDDALDAVAGGANAKEAFWSIISIGLMCVSYAIVSATGDGVGDGPNGKILCNNDYTEEEKREHPIS